MSTLSMSNEVIRDPIIVTLGQTQPSLPDIITFNGVTVDMSQPGTSVVFFMRPLLSRTPVINGASASTISPPDANGNNVYYQWQTADVAIEGRYMGWWGYELPTSTLIETPEFPIIITDHGPGFGTGTGVVVDGVAQFMPITFERLRQDNNFGDRFLQRAADYVKRIVLGTVVSPDLEALYDPALVDYLSKRTAVRLIAPAKDYWARQYRQVLTQGPSESATYPDMLMNLDNLCLRLSHELPADWRQLQFLVPGLPQLRVEPMPMSSLGDPSLPANQPVTGNPQANPPARTGGPHWNPFFQF